MDQRRDATPIVGWAGGPTRSDFIDPTPGQCPLALGDVGDDSRRCSRERGHEGLHVVEGKAYTLTPEAQQQWQNVGGTGETSNMRSMTAPNPEQMRALANEANQFADAHNVQGETLSGDRYWRISATLRAAADEVDRLRAELAISENRASGYQEVVARLRAVIENAPHFPGCEMFTIDGSWKCTCWKADAP